MAQIIRHILSVLWIFYWNIATVQGKAEDYCSRETFVAECSKDEAIHMKSAVFGRMEVGKCVDKPQGRMGCNTTVMHLVGSACTGKQECRYDVHSSELVDTKPCGHGWEAYLRVDYECVPVLTTNTTVCESAPWVPSEQSHGFVSTEIARHYSCGNMMHPWKFNVMPGQRINITLISFSKTEEKHGRKKCKPIGYIVEAGHRNNVTICSKKGGNEHMYTSNGRHVDIYLITYRERETDPDYLLEYKVFGCPDVKVPPFAWYSREDDITTIGCERNDKKWVLVCEDGQWKGSIGQCPDSVAASRSMMKPSEEESDVIKLVTLGSLGIGFIVFSVLTAVVIKIRLKNSTNERTPSTILLQAQGQEFN